MSKRVLFVVVDTADSKIKENTKKSVNENLGKEDALVFIKTSDEEKRELYCNLKNEANKIVNDVNNFDYVCLIPNGSVLNNEAKAIFSEYQHDREDNVREIYLPLVMYKTDEMTVIMNKHIWNSMIAYEAGVLDIELALKQIDSTIFGAFIPTDLFFNAEYYNADLKYYQQYHILNNLADGSNLTLGIPKLLITLNDWDFKMKEVSDEVKIENFNLARAKWSKKEVKVEVAQELQTQQA